jgi:uncharacterized membrane protein
MSRGQADLGITAVVTVLVCAAAAIGAPVGVTAVLGIALFMASGYLLSELLLGSYVTGIERVAVGTGLAFCVPILGGLLMAAAGVPLRRTAWLGLFAGVILCSDVILFLRRRFGSQASAGRRPQGWRLRPRQAAAFGVAAMIAVSAVGLARVGAAVQQYPGYTQLWLVRPNKAVPTVNLGVVNQEGRTVRYRLVLARNGHSAVAWNLVLANGQAWRRSEQYPGRYTISVNLFRLPNVSQPYRHVVLNRDETQLP